MKVKFRVTRYDQDTGLKLCEHKVHNSKQEAQECADKINKDIKNVWDRWQVTSARIPKAG